MSRLHAAGTHITHGHPLRGTAAKERGGEGKGGGARTWEAEETEGVTKP